MKFDSEASTHDARRENSRGQWILAWLVRVELLWFLFCLFGGRISEVFRSASDRLEDSSRILAFVVVNPAFHLALAFVATLFIGARSRTVTAVGVAGLNALLIVAHVVISLIIA